MIHEQGNDQTLSLYGAYRSTIHWDSLDPIRFRTDFPLFGRGWTVILFVISPLLIFAGTWIFCLIGLMQPVGESEALTFLASAVFFSLSHCSPRHPCDNEEFMIWGFEIYSGTFRRH